MKRTLKSIPYMILLIAASGYLGMFFRKIYHKGSSLIDISFDNLYFILYSLLAIALVFITASLVVVLVRPFWLALISYALSGITMFAIWGKPWILSGISCLIYFGVLALFDKSVNDKLHERIDFSVHPISESKSTLILLILILFCACFYFGIVEEVKIEGFKIPAFITNITVKSAESMMGEEVKPEEKEMVVAEIRDKVESQIGDAIAKYKRWIPLGLAWIILSIMEILIVVLFWIPVLVLQLIFYVLHRFHITSYMTETKEVKRLILS